jgi:hypothetical protein
MLAGTIRLAALTPWLLLLLAGSAYGNTVSVTSSEGFAGWRQWVEVSLSRDGPELSILSVDIGFDGESVRIASDRGKPVCEVDEGHGKSGVFAIRPIACYGDQCTSIRGILIDFAAIDAIPDGPLFRCRVDIQPGAKPGRYPLTVSGDAASVQMVNGSYAAEVAGVGGAVVVREPCGACGCPDGVGERWNAVVIGLEGAFVIEGRDRGWTATVRAFPDTGLVSGYLEFAEAIDGLPGSNLSGFFEGNVLQLHSSAGQEPSLGFVATVDSDTASGSFSWDGSPPVDWSGIAELKSPIRRVSDSIVEGLRDGIPQEGIVSIFNGDIRRATQGLSNEERNAEKRRLYALRKEEIWAALTGARIEIIYDSEVFPTMVVRFMDLEALAALLTRPEVQYVHENRGRSIDPPRTRKPAQAATSAAEPIGVLEIPTVERLLPECNEWPCPGDCNHDGRVGIAELLVATRISMGSADMLQCTAVDTNLDGLAAVAELIAATNAAMHGCERGD